MTIAAPAITVRLVTEPDDVDALVPVLLLAEPSERALRWSLANLMRAQSLSGALWPSAGS